MSTFQSLHMKGESLNLNPRRNVRKLPHLRTTFLPWCYLPNHKSFGYSEVLMHTTLLDGRIWSNSPLHFAVSSMPVEIPPNMLASSSTIIPTTF